MDFAVTSQFGFIKRKLELTFNEDGLYYVIWDLPKERFFRFGGPLMLGSDRSNINEVFDFTVEFVFKKISPFLRSEGSGRIVKDPKGIDVFNAKSL
mmetsp:Transcript_39095/g.28900  ORF Transcript_39095/g.28900 Transcript_39095/m.28900 type:complete len:96 (-) Transcript_39095:356-643(-)